MTNLREAADRVRKAAYLHNSYTKLRPALRELAVALDAPPPAGSLREAARALLAELVDSPMETLEDLNRRGYGIPAACRALEAALDAPPPGLEELRAKLEHMWDTALGYGISHDGPMDEDDPERDHLIAELLALWESR